MSRDIPFFEMFTELQLSGELRLKLAGAVLTGARIDQGQLSAVLHLTLPSSLSEADMEDLKRMIPALYGLH